SSPENQRKDLRCAASSCISLLARCESTSVEAPANAGAASLGLAVVARPGLRGSDLHGHRLTQHPALRIGAVLHLAGQLAASRIDVGATRLANGGDDAGIDQDAGKGLDPPHVGAAQARLREGIEGNQVELAVDAPLDKGDQLVCMRIAVVDAIE